MVVFRSVLVPLKAVIMNLLSIGAAYGVVVAVFQWGWLERPHRRRARPGPIEPFIPMMMFAILFGLSMDYEVFLLSRIREEYDRTGDNARRGRRRPGRDRPGHHRGRAIMVVRLRQLRARRRPASIKLFGLGLAVADLHRRHRRPHGARAGDDGAARRRATGGCRSWLDRLLPRLHVEAGPDVDAELARLAAEERVPVAGS